MKKIKLPLGPHSLVVRWANRMRAYYGHPIFLVGSQLTDKQNPGDVDIICLIPDDEFELRFGIKVGDWNHEGGTHLFSENYWQWTERCIKDTFDGIRHTRLKIDFKVYPDWLALAHPVDKFPRVQLDTRDISIKEHES